MVVNSERLMVNPWVGLSAESACLSVLPMAAPMADRLVDRWALTMVG
jgi:hypothetical protein